MNWKLLLVIGIACAGLAALGLFLRTGERGLELTILHTNDLHAHYDPFQPWGEVEQGGVARIKSLVDVVRDKEENVLFLDAGDQFQGTLFFTVGGPQIVADVMNELGYDAMAIGNHEFDSGPATLADFISMADFPVLSANIDASGDADLAGMIPPYEVFEFDGRDVAVIGLTTETTSYASSPGPDIRFLDTVEAAQRAVDQLEAQGVDIIIALTHIGTSWDVAVAEATEGIDIFVGGHSHTYLDTYPLVTTSARGEPVLVVTANEWGKYLGRLDVTFSDSGLVKAYGGHLAFVDDAIREDRSVAAILDAYRPEIEALLTHVVGTAEVDLNAEREDVRARETNLGNLICDAMLWKAAAFGATVAIQNGGGIRSSIPAGEITMGQILEVLPYGNQITTVTITGEELLAALENGVSQVEDDAGRFPHVGGMRFTFDPAAEPGSRVTGIEVWNSDSAGYIPLDLAGTYTLATNNYLADGGDGYDYSSASDRYESGWLLSDTLAEYIESVDVVAPEVEGRITILEQPEATEPTGP